MWTKEKQKKRRKLTSELLAVIVIDVLVSVLSYFLLRSWAGTVAYNYCEKKQIGLDELQSIVLDSLIFNLSIVGSVVIFVVLFLVFVGRKLAYIRDLTASIHALRTHHMDFEIPLEGNNELTELAESINYLAETERQLKAVERNLSHDIRTPLTAMLSYAEYMQGKEQVTEEDLYSFLEMVKRKGEQMKVLTEKLLDGGSQLVEIEDGRLLMVQLADEWEECLEDQFACQVDTSQCPNFSGQFDIEELRRVFDNLSSNVSKYADAEEPVYLSIFTKNQRIVIRQSNGKPLEQSFAESRKIGLTSIDTIAKHYGGDVKVEDGDTNFSIEIMLFMV